MKYRIANLEKSVEEFKEDIKEIKNILYNIHEDNTLLKKDIYGNGKKGLIKKVEDIENNIGKHNKIYVYFIAIISVITFLPKIKEFLILMK